jgi:mannose-1-phosphate guanylyltransferase
MMWTLILAGGDGTRLRSLTRQITGDARPKQFCPLLDGETLLDRTRRRADLLARFDEQVIVVTRAHAPYHDGLARDLAPDRLVVQPSNRDTGPGILLPLLRIEQLAGDVPVAILPSDHFVSDDAQFVAHIRGAHDIVETDHDLITLLGVEASGPETEYGWIERASEPLSLPTWPAFGIRAFHEKPSLRLARQLFRRGALWNTFVMVARVRTLLGLVAGAAPDLAAAFRPVRRALGTDAEATALERVYASLGPISFSRSVLARRPERLAAVPVQGVEWSDWGHPDRVLTMVQRMGWRPEWLGKIALAAAG